MLKDKIISIDELSRFGQVSTFNEQAETLIRYQRDTWPLAGKNYLEIQNIKKKTFDFEHCRIVTQFNPERLRSSAANTDTESIAGRPCFLCLENLPEKQKGFLLLGKYLVLANPYPIFPVHLTISDTSHVPQLIEGRLTDLLRISRELTNFIVFYNGPLCGASAPDHFHFQAAINGYMPIENEISEKTSEPITVSEKVKISSSKNFLRRFIAIESKDKTALTDQFGAIYRELEKRNQNPEPMMNILCRFVENKWQLIIFPRDKQRPCHFFLKDKNQIVVGPAAVELGGLMVLPRKEDFDKITREKIVEIYKDVTINDRDFKKVISAF